MSHPPLDKKTRDNKQHLKEPLLKVFKEKGTIQTACDSVGIHRRTFYRWRDDDPAFDEAFRDADSAVTDLLERTAMSRALKDSDTLMIFLLKSRNPEKYKERYQQDIDPKVIDLLVTQFLNSVKKHAPEFCPHCKNHLGLTNKIAKELEGLSTKMAGV